MQVYYSNERVKRANEGSLTFFIRGIQNPEYLRCVVPAFPEQSDFWGHLASGNFYSDTYTQTDICPPTVDYFLKVLANTLLCKMEPNKVWVQELTLLQYAVWSKVDMGEISEPAHDQWPNLGAIFAKHLVKLKMEPFGGKSRKRETVGSRRYTLATVTSADGYRSSG